MDKENSCPFLKMEPTFFIEGQRIFIYKKTLKIIKNSIKKIVKVFQNGRAGADIMPFS